MALLPSRGFIIRIDLYPCARPTLSKVDICRNARDHARANLPYGNRKIHTQCPLRWDTNGSVLKAIQMDNGSPNWALR